MGLFFTNVSVHNRSRNPSTIRRQVIENAYEGTLVDHFSDLKDFKAMATMLDYRVHCINQSFYCAKDKDGILMGFFEIQMLNNFKANGRMIV